MKKITLILITLFAFIYANAQYTVPRGLPYHDTRWIENKGVAGATYLFDSIVMFRNIADTQMKPLYPAMGYLQNFDGDSTLWIWDMVRWKKLATGSGGTGSNNTNLGSAYRWLNETSQGIKTVNKGFGIGLDSLTTGEIRITADTSKLPTRYTIDSLSLLIGGGTVTSVGLTMPTGFSVANSPVTTSGTLAVTTTLNGIIKGTGSGFGTVVVGSGLSYDGTTLTSTGSGGSVTNFSAGNLSPLFTTSVATSTSTPALTFALTNAAGGTVFGNNTGSSAAPAYTAVPVLGIAGTTKGTIGLAGNTSGVVTIQPAAAAGTWTFTLPTTGGTNNYVLTTNGSGTTTWTDVTTIATGTVTSFSAGNLSPLFTTSVATASTTPALTFALTNAAAGTVFGNATASAAAPSYTTHPVIGVASGSTGILGISGTTSGTVSLSAADAAGTWTMKLPTTGGTNLYFLQTDGSGNTTWAAPFTLTTTGTSGAATFSSGTLNVPNYATSGNFWPLSTSTLNGTLLGQDTIISNTPSQLHFSGAYTTTANSQFYREEIPTITLRGTASDITTAVKLAPVFIGGANTQQDITLDIAPTYTVGAFTGTVKTAIRSGGDIVPTIDEGYDLGKLATRWNSVFGGFGEFDSRTTTPVIASTGTSISFRNSSGNTAAYFVNTTDLVLNPKLNTAVDANYRADIFGEVRAMGVNVTQLGAPSFTVTQQGTPGSTSYTYVVQGVLVNGSTTPISTVTTATGNATLGATNFNRISITAQPGVYQYNVYRSASSGSPGTTGLLASGTITVAWQNTSLPLYDDKAFAASGSIPTNTTDMTGYISAFYYKYQSYTSAQITAMTGLAAGDAVYCSDCTANDASTGVLQVYNGSVWKKTW